MNQSTYYTILFVAILLGIVVLFFLVSIIRYHRRYVKLQQERMRAEIAMQEKERFRIAGDLHNTLGPLLSTIKTQIDSVESEERVHQQALLKARRYVDEVLMSVDQISNHLLPKTLQEKGLPEAMKEFAAMHSQKNGLKVNFYLMSPVSVDKERETHLFRLIQEITSNTIAHAYAKTLQIGLGQETGEIVLITKDDGRGFDVNKARKDAEALGLKSIASRVDILKGNYILKSSAAEGTSYFIKFPVD